MTVHSFRMSLVTLEQRAAYVREEVAAGSETFKLADAVIELAELVEALAGRVRRLAEIQGEA